MTNKPNTKRNVTTETDVSNLKTKVEAARKALSKALVAGDRTDQLRTYLRELEAEQKNLDDAAAAQESAQRAAQQALAQIEADRVAESAATIKEARDNRIAAIATRFAIPVRPVFDSRDSFHA